MNTVSGRIKWMTNSTDEKISHQGEILEALFNSACETLEEMAVEFSDIVKNTKNSVRQMAKKKSTTASMEHVLFKEVDRAENELLHGKKAEKAMYKLIKGG